MKNKLTKKQKDLIEDNYDIIRWIDADTALVHYWDDDNGDFYLEEKATDLLDNKDLIEDRTDTIKPISEENSAQLTAAGYRLAYVIMTLSGNTTEVWVYDGTSLEVSSDGHTRKN